MNQEMNEKLSEIKGVLTEARKMPSEMQTTAQFAMQTFQQKDPTQFMLHFESLLQSMKEMAKQIGHKKLSVALAKAELEASKVVIANAKANAAKKGEPTPYPPGFKPQLMK